MSLWLRQNFTDPIYQSSYSSSHFSASFRSTIEFSLLADSSAHGYLHSLRDHKPERLKTELVDDLTRGLWIVHAHDRPSNRCSSIWRNESLPQNLLHRFSFCELINQLV